MSKKKARRWLDKKQPDYEEVVLKIRGKKLPFYKKREIITKEERAFIRLYETLSLDLLRS